MVKTALFVRLKRNREKRRRLKAFARRASDRQRKSPRRWRGSEFALGRQRSESSMLFRMRQGGKLTSREKSRQR